MISERCCTVRLIAVASEFWRASMKRVKFLRSVWFRNQAERDWFAAQLAMHYESFRKSVVLYALNRLVRIFKMPMTSLEGGIQLVVLYDAYLQAGKRGWRSFLLPTEINGNPLQTITDDCSYAEDDYRTATENGRTPIPPLVSLREHATVADYVRFIVDYDAICRNCYHSRITSALASVG